MAFSFPRGETIVLIAQVIAGDPTLVASSSAALRPALPSDPTLVDPSRPATASFAVSLQAAASDGSYPAMWVCTIDAATCATLPIGAYCVDIRLVFTDASIWISAPLQVTITEPATTS